jgi:hypothetical protein
MAPGQAWARWDIEDTLRAADRPLTGREVADRSGRGYVITLHWLRVLAANGQAERKGRGTRDDPYCWRAAR